MKLESNKPPSTSLKNHMLTAVLLHSVQLAGPLVLCLIAVTSIKMCIPVNKKHSAHPHLGVHLPQLVENGGDIRCGHEARVQLGAAAQRAAVEHLEQIALRRVRVSACVRVGVSVLVCVVCEVY